MKHIQSLRLLLPHRYLDFHFTIQQGCTILLTKTTTALILDTIK